ncbi:MAG: DUF790 family protein [Methanotrichaceae archaeon]|nr:DUF790 family protein [Methanotrichaceae archaeon]
MLTSDLLVTRTYKGKIEPVYAKLDRETLEIANSIIELFQRHVGKTYGELIEEVEGFEGIDYRLIRGIAQILERKCIIDKDSVLDPIAARRAIFEESKGFITNEEERKAILDRAGRKLSIKPSDLEKALWADQEENLVVREFHTITPEKLLSQYNLSLAQTLLFRATGVEIRLENNYQQVFRKIKQLGLMYSILDGVIYLDGPISLFKLTEKYGTSIAKLLPTIIISARWSLKAGILRKTSRGKRIYDFLLDHTKKQIFGSEFAIEETFSFDSAIEKEFYQLSFNGWMIKREPTILKAGQYAFIPDFSMEFNGTKIYIEIIGFWTPEYLKNKIQKINHLNEKENIILLVDRNLSCSGSEFKAGNLIFFERRIPHLEIIKLLRKYREKQRTEEIRKLRSIEVSIDSSIGIISLDEVARRYGVSLEALIEVIKDQNKTDYLFLGDQLVSNRILKIIEDELNGVKKHDAALRIFEKHGIRAHCQMLESLGYRVKWSGLDPENAEILKK